MIIAALIRFAPITLVAMATAASAQFVTVPYGAPVVPPNVAPGTDVGPGGRSGSIAQGSSMGEADWQRDAQNRFDGKRGSPKTRQDAGHPANAGDLVTGASIVDNKGAEVGYIKAVESDGVVVATLAGAVKVPAEALGKNKAGLLIGMSKTDFDKLVTSANGG